MKNKLLSLISAVIIGFFVIACGDGGAAAEEEARIEAERVADSIAVAEQEAEAAAAAAMAPKSIAETAMNTESLSTLVAALKAGDLAETFMNDGNYTVFAPTNEAFAGAQSTVDMLLMPENKSKLQSVLKYHVVDGAAMAADLSDGQELTTLQGEKLMVKIADGKVMINNAEVVMADVEASNGVVHVINQPLVPKNM